MAAPTMETLPTDVFLDILARAGGWSTTMPEGMVVVTALSVCKQWRHALLGSPAHAVDVLISRRCWPAHARAPSATPSALTSCGMSGCAQPSTSWNCRASP
jgi:hypothetical protein